MRKVRPFIIILLLIEFLDELVFGIREAAWPLIRDDLHLNYTQIGLLLSMPGLISSLVEPVLGLLGDTAKRSRIVFYGGLAFAAALFLTAASSDFYLLLAAFILFYPASGAFVSLSQADLMDDAPDRHEQNMARWTFAGSIGVTLGPFLLAGVIAAGLDWRTAFAATGAAALVLALWMRPDRGRTGPTPHRDAAPAAGFRDNLRNMLGALKLPGVARWLVLLEFSDMMLDILLGFLALYLVDAAGATPAQAGIAVGVWSVAGLVGDFLLIPLLERVRGLDYLRVSVVLELFLFPVFLLLPDLTWKIVVLAFLGFFNAGWYAILKGQLYSSLPGRSGTVMALNNLAGTFATLIPLGIGWAAQTWGISIAMWSLLIGPAGLLAGIAGRMRQLSD